MIIEKISTANDGTYKDLKTEQVFTVKDLNQAIADQATAFNYFKKVEYPKGASKEVIAAIDYYNERFIQEGIAAAQMNIDLAGLKLQQISSYETKLIKDAK